uniref:Putative secreted protein n=1 Tax=Anopheles triannulatus TaxID=58253 RepID=A0A2M4B577_9DIPT
MAGRFRLFFDIFLPFLARVSITVQLPDRWSLRIPLRESVVIQSWQRLTRIVNTRSERKVMGNLEGDCRPNLMAHTLTSGMFSSGLF